MAKMSKVKTETLAKYRQRIDAAKAFRRHEQLDDLWDRLVDLYRGKQYDKSKMTYDDLIVVNIAFATINVIVPSVAINYPKLTVNATTMEADDSAVIAEEVLNYWWRHFDFQPEIQAAVKDYLVVGFGWLKCGWRFVEEDQLDEQGREAEFQKAKAEAAQFAFEQPELADSLPSDLEIADQIEETYRSVTIEDRPFVERVSFKDVFVDPEATSMRDARWVAHRIVKTIDEVKGNEHYDLRARNAVKSDTRADVPYEGSETDWRSESSEDQDFDRVTVWEFYDIHSGQMAVFTEQGDRFLIAPTDQPYVFGHPFVMLRNFDVPDQFYPMGDLEAIEPLQHELNLTRTAMFNDRKGFRRKFLYRRDAVDREARAALESDKDNVFVPIDGSEELDKVVAHMPTSAPNQALYQDTGIIEDDIVKVTGLSDYQRGETPEIRRTATEASIIQDAANARAADKLAKVEKVIGEVGRRLLMLAQQYLDTEQTFRVTGVNGQPIWFEFDADDIAGEFDFEVEGGSTQPKNEQTRRRGALDLMQALGPLMDPQLGLINVPELLRHVLKDGFGLKNPERFLSGGQDPVTAGMGDPEMAPADQMGPEAALQAALAQAEGGGGAPQPQGEAPLALPPGLPPEMAAMMGGGGMPPEEAPAPVDASLPPELLAALQGAGGAGLEQVPPELLAQLVGQVGLQL